MCGLAACEPLTPHGDLAGETRCRLIFRWDGQILIFVLKFKILFFFLRYYNSSGSGRLSFSEFTRMVKDIRVIKGCSDDEEDVKSEAAISAK